MHPARRKMAGRPEGDVFDQLVARQKELERGAFEAEKPLSSLHCDLAQHFKNTPKKFRTAWANHRYESSAHRTFWRRILRNLAVCVGCAKSQAVGERSMLVCISPAKKLDWSVVERRNLTQPDFAQEALRLVETARALSVEDLQKLMSISKALASLNRDRVSRLRNPAGCRSAAACGFGICRRHLPRARGREFK